jgi:hemerythrin superfamily protein
MPKWKMQRLSPAAAVIMAGLQVEYFFGCLSAAHRETGMSFSSQILPDHHRHCDALFAAAEALVERGDWDAARPAFEHFNAQMQAHFDAEESVLFPAFESATGMIQGPTQMMRYEHQQMRSLLAQLEFACDGKDADGYAGAAETLLMLMQQHNMKEENILYPMCGQALTAEARDLDERIGGMLEKGDA